MVEILDAHGRPLRRAELTEPQTARVGSLPQPIGLHPSRGLTPGKLARILEEAEVGDLQAQLDLAEDMEEKDGHTFAELSKRRRALLGLPREIVPPRNATAAEERATEAVRELLAGIDLEDVILEMADAILKGFACLELDWKRTGREWAVQAAELRPQRWFTISREADQSIRLRDGSALGEPLIPGLWITHVHKARSGHLSRASLSRILAWPYLFKNYSVRDLAEFLEIYGLPLRLGTYPRGASDTEKATLLRAVLSIGHAAAGIVPEGMGIDFHESAKGASDPFMAMMDWCERTQSKAILGATLTSQADRGSNTNALGNVHNEVRRDLLVSDARQIAQTLTRDLLFPLAALNTGVADRQRTPRFRFTTEEAEDLALYADALPKLSTVLEIPARWAYERLQIPAPEKNEPILEPRTPAALPPTAPLRAALKTTTGDEDPPAQMVDRLDDQVAPVLDAWINQIKQLVDSAESLEQIRDGLLALYPNMNLDDYADAMAEALAAASLAGRYEILEEI